MDRQIERIEEKVLPYSRKTTNKCRKNDGMRKLPFGNHCNNN